MVLLSCLLLDGPKATAQTSGVTPATLTPSLGTLAASQTFTWSNGVGPTKYELWLGTTGAGSSNLYNSGAITATSATVSIPSDGVTVYATLCQLIDGAWNYTYYTFTESGTTTPATLTPSSGTLSTSQTFTWSNGVGPAKYELWLGTTGAGSSNVYNSGAITATSAAVSIPPDGVTVYATLCQLIDDTWNYTYYTFTESGTTTKATLTPSTGTLSTSQTFTWSNGVGPAEYQLLLGTAGAGSSNLYNSGAITVTSATVSIPASGVTVYATLKQLIDDTWQATSYTFTEPVSVSAMSCASGSITGAGTDACTVTLNAAAGTGGQAVSLSSSATAVTVPSSLTVAAGASSASFTATISAVSSAETATLTASSGGGTETYAISLGAAVSTLTVSGTSVSFGTVSVGATGSGSVTLSSTGTVAVTVSAGSVSGTGYTISGVSFPLTLNPGQTATLDVAFNPTAAGSVSGSVTLTSNSSSGETSTISLSGTGQPVLSGLTCTSGSITGAASDACTVTLNAAAGTAGFPVSLASSSTMVTVPASVTVAAGTASASFSASVSAVSTTQTATISASATSADPSFVIQLNPVTTTAIHLNAHGVTDIGATLTASPITVLLSNVAAGDLIVCEVSLESAATFASVSDPINGTYSPALAMHTNAPISQQLGIFAIPNAAAGSYSVSVAWTGGAQSYQAMSCQSWTGVATSAPQDTTMSEQQDGTSANATAGSLLTPAAVGELVIGNAMIGNNSVTAGTNYTITDVAAITQVFPEYWIQTTATATNAPYVNPTNSSWTDQMVAFKPISSGAGTVAPSITSATAASGTVGSSFSYQITATNTPTSYGATGLPAGLTVSSSTGLISGTPTATGTSAVTLTATNAEGTGTASLSLTIAAGQPELSVNATSVPFGDVTEGSPAFQSVTLSSSGTAAVTVSAGSVSGSGYTISGVSFPATLNPGATATLEIEFDPATAGVSNGTITLTSNSSTGTTSTISLSGTGVTSSSSNEVTLTWDAPTDSSDPVAGYNIYRAVSGSYGYQMLNSSVDTSTGFTDTTVAANTSYTYYVESVDAEGNQSAPSNTYAVSIP